MEQVLKSLSSLPLHLSCPHPTLDNKEALAINPSLGANLKCPTATSHMGSFIHLPSYPQFKGLDKHRQLQSPSFYCIKVKHHNYDYPPSKLPIQCLQLHICSRCIASALLLHYARNRNRQLVECCKVSTSAFESQLVYYV